jgi:hypothetical protein
VFDLFGFGDGTPAAGIDGTLDIGNTNTALVDFDGTNYDVSGNVTVESKTGNFITFSDTSGTAIDFRTTGAGSSIGFSTGTIKISDRTAALEITSNNGSISIAAVEGTHDEDITINAGSGTLAVGAIGVTEVEGINTVALTSSTGITLSGSITTSNAAGNNVTLTGPVIISGTVDIDTDTGTDGNISFTSTIRGDGNGNTTDALILDTGTGTLSFDSTNTIIGETNPLASLSINQGGGTVALTIPQIGGSGGTTAGVTGAVTIGTGTTATVTMEDALYNFGTGNVIITAASTGTGTTFSAANTDVNSGGGNITINNKVVIADGELDINSGGGDISITGAISSAGVDEALILDDGTGSGTITLGSTVTSGSITLIGDTGISLAGNLISTDTPGGAISLTGPVTLAGDITIDADADNTTVTFTSTATVNSDGTPRDLTINTGAGAIAMQGVIGGSAELDVISINSATTGAGTIEITNTQADGAVSIGNSNLNCSSSCCC